MEFLLDPNVSYLLLVSGLVIGILALLSPGTGIYEIGALLLLVLASYGIYNQPVNLWSLGIILLGVIAFIVALKIKNKLRWAILTFSAAGLIIGSLFLFRPIENEPALHPAFIIVTTLLAETFLYWVGSKTLDAVYQEPVHNPDRVINMVGTAYSDIFEEGTAYVDGEEWTARSEKPIPAGSEIRVVSRDGLMLTVEAVNPNHPNN